MLEFTQIVVLHNPSHICYKMHKKLWGRYVLQWVCSSLYFICVYYILYVYTSLYFICIYYMCI